MGVMVSLSLHRGTAPHDNSWIPPVLQPNSPWRYTPSLLFAMSFHTVSCNDIKLSCSYPVEACLSYHPILLHQKILTSRNISDFSLSMFQVIRPLFFFRFLSFIPITMNTTPFQNPLNDPIDPTARYNGNDTKSGLMKLATRFTVGATQIANSRKKNISGMRMYFRNDTGGRRGGWLSKAPVGGRLEEVDAVAEVSKARSLPLSCGLGW